MPLSFGNHVFGIATATLFAKLPDPYWLSKYYPQGDLRLCWMMDIRFEKQLVDRELWSPSIYHESMYLPIRRWVEVEGQCLKWNSPFDEMTGESNGGFYVFEHGDLPRGRLHFARRTGQRFNVVWTGELEVYPMCPEPFTLEADVVFTGIRVDGCAMDTDASLERRLREHIQLDGLVAEPKIPSQSFCKSA